MSSIFISHSSRDGKWATEVRRRLELQGHRSVFLDFDPADGIPAGRDWEQELYHQLRSCRAVVVLCSRHSMESRWCFAEITHAKSMGKPLLPLKIDDCEVDSVLTSGQVIDLTVEPEDAWQRLWRGLVVAGLDPADAFDWQGDRPPYPGLLSFQEKDAAVFFGRDTEIQAGLETLQRLRQFGGARWLMALGASGSGKSSLVRAGLIPRLRRDRQRWLVLDPFRPGQDPFWELTRVLTRALGKGAASEQIYQLLQGASFEPPATLGESEVAVTEPLQDLERALGRIGSPEALRYLNLLREEVERTPTKSVVNPAPRQTGHPLVDFAFDLLERTDQTEARVLLVVDQFEELLGHTDDSTAGRFLGLLRQATDQPESPVLVLATLRSDFFAVFQQDPNLSELRPATLAVGPLAPAGVAQTILEPARLAGLDLESGLVEALVADSRSEDSLPLLAFALRELWERFADDGRLRVEEYQRLGGISGAVARVADAVLAAATLGPRQERQLRSAFLHLSRINAAGQFARQPARWEDLPLDLHPVLERFVQARLLVSRGEGEHRLLEVAHEALFRSWDKLRAWLDEDREFLLWRKRLQAAQRQWLDTDQDEGGLLRGVALADAEHWLSDRPAELGEERVFVEQSVAVRDREVRLAARRRRWVLQGTTIAALVCLVLAFQAWRESLRFQQLSTTRRAALVVQASNDLLDPVTRTLLLLEGAAMLPGEEPVGGAREARRVAGTAIPRSVLYGPRGPVVDIAFSPDNEYVATASYDSSLRVFSSDGLGRARVFEGHEGDVSTVEFDPAGERLLTSSVDGTARIWAVDSGAEPIVLQAGDTIVHSARFSPDGHLAVAATEAGSVLLFTPDTEAPPRQLEGHTGAVLEVRFSPDGRWILSVSKDGTARLWNTASGESRVVSEHDDWVLDGVWSDDGSQLATTSRDHTVWVCQLQNLGSCQRLEGHDGWVWKADFSADGTRLVTGSADNTARIWQLDDSAEPVVLAGHEDWVRDVSFSADGRRVLTASHDGSGALWWVDGKGEPVVLDGHEGWVRKAIFSPDGTLVATASDDNTARLWPSAPPADPHILVGHSDQVWSASFDHQGDRLVSASADKTARIWDLTNQESVAILEGHTQRVRSAEFSPDDRLVATASDDGSARIWSVYGSAEPLILRGHRDKVLDVNFSHDGRYLVTSSYDSTLALWQSSGTLVRTFRDHDLWVRDVVFSRDDRQILSASADRTVRLRNTDGSGAVRIVGRHSNQVMSAVFQRDGTKVLSASADRTARFWDAAGEDLELERFLGHESLVWSADVSPDGSRVITASQDHTARVWQVANPAAEPVFLDGHSGPVWDASFSPDGRTIATASADKTVRLWKLWDKDWQQLIELLRETTNACLPLIHRQRFLSESAAEATAGYEACEVSYGRLPVR